MNTLYYGDNLDILRRYVKDETVDLIYLDPPFKSNQDYNVLFAEQDGSRAAAQIMAFEDTWRWDEAAARAYHELVSVSDRLSPTGGKVSDVMRAFHTFLGGNDMMAYLAMMAPRLVELRRVLKPTGSIYLHCDPTASHYLKLLMDAVFGPESFRTEIIWKRSSAHSDTKQGRRQHGRLHDTILFYTKSESWIWNPLYTEYDENYTDQFYKYVEPDTNRRYRLDNLTGPGGAAKGNPKYEVMRVTRYWRYSKQKMKELIAEGRIVQTKPGAVPAYKRYLDEMPGVSLQDLWTDLRPIQSQAIERLGYPTQKPEALLERIIKASSNEGDVVLDPFCGCGTAVAVAQKLNRQWIGIDITHLAITLIKQRLFDAFAISPTFTGGTKGGREGGYQVLGEPVDLSGATQLAEDDKYQFQWWSLGLVHARPVEQKKGADQGIDGRRYFLDHKNRTHEQIIFSVKGGHTNAAHIRDLIGVITSESSKAAIGVLITLEKPTKPMFQAAAEAGFYKSDYQDTKHPRIQIVTIEELLEGKQLDLPALAMMPSQDATFKKAPKAKGKKAGNEEMEL